MNKRILLTSVAILTILSSMTATTSVLADEVQADKTTQTDGNATGVIAGPDEKKIDTSIAHPSTIEAPTMVKNDNQSIIVQASSSYVSPAQQQAFLNKAVPLAQQAAAKYGLYTSVMLAQAILESQWGQSSLATEANNLFGMKGDYNGATYSVKTREWSAAKGNYYITANFRKYASYAESFADNGNKLRNGVAWDSAYYKGTWKENASSYKDATAWLQGRYATDPNYANSLNNVIATYGLTKYDQQPVAETNASAQADHVVRVKDANSNYVSLVKFENDGSMKNVTNRALANDTDWYTDKSRVYNGVTYRRVATNEWVAMTYVI